MLPFRTLLMILAIVCFVLSAAEVTAPRVNLQGLGLAFWAIATTLA